MAVTCEFSPHFFLLTLTLMMSMSSVYPRSVGLTIDVANNSSPCAGKEMQTSSDQSILYLPSSSFQPDQYTHVVDKIKEKGDITVILDCPRAVDPDVVKNVMSSPSFLYTARILTNNTNKDIRVKIWYRAEPLNDFNSFSQAAFCMGFTKGFNKEIPGAIEGVLLTGNVPVPEVGVINQRMYWAAAAKTGTKVGVNLELMTEDSDCAIEIKDLPSDIVRESNTIDDSNASMARTKKSLTKVDSFPKSTFTKFLS